MRDKKGRRSIVKEKTPNWTLSGRKGQKNTKKRQKKGM